MLKGVEGGFCQLCHGKRTPLQHLSPGDWIVYYSPRSQREGGSLVQAFTALGQIEAGEPHTCDLGIGVFHRRNVRFLAALSAPIRPLLEKLSFIPDRQRWGYVFRFGLVEIPKDDFRAIAQAMQAAWESEKPAS